MVNAHRWDAVFANSYVFNSGMNCQEIYASANRAWVAIAYCGTGGTKDELEALKERSLNR
jgi:hypothetical protein